MHGRTYADLSQQFGVPLKTIAARAVRENWIIAEQAVAECIRGAIPRGEGMNRVQQRVANLTVDAVSEFLRSSLEQARSIMNAGTDLVSKARRDGDARAARDAAAAWAIGHQGARQSLGLDRDTHGRETPWAQSPIIDVTPLPAAQSVIDVGSSSPQPTGEGASD